jgi:lipopolysaccharide export system protein LptA
MQRFLKSFILVLALLFMGGLFYWALFIPKEEITQRIQRTIAEQGKRADLSFKKVIFEEISAGIKYWELVAETAMLNKDQGIATLKSVEGTFYKRGEKSLKFRSPSAIWDMKKKEIYLDKPFGYDVALENKASKIMKTIKNEPLSVFHFPKIYKKEAGYWFRANNLSWKLSDQHLVCTGGIMLNKGEVTAWAESLSGDVALEKFSLLGNPRITILPQNDVPLTFEAEAFEVISTQDTIIAQGNPTISWKSARVTSDKAKYLQSENEINFEGNVKLNYKDITAAGQNASYLISAQQVIFQGRSWAVQGSNSLSGEKVLVSIKEKKIALLGQSRVVITNDKLQPAATPEEK